MSQSPTTYDPSAPRQGEPTPAIAWTPEQLVRLEFDWRQLQRSFAYHPAVRINPLHGDPPDEYQIDFRVRTLVTRDDGALDYVTACSAILKLPPEYPHAGPMIRPIESIFHPNVLPDEIMINPPWDPTATLVDVMTRVGKFLAYQNYDPWNVWNQSALDWLNANTDLLPTDADVNFEVDAGGDPLARICRYGTSSLHQLRGQLRLFDESLVNLANPPSFADLQDFCTRIRMAVSMFHSDELPEALRVTATELDEWAAQLKGINPTFEALRKQKAATVACLAADNELNASNKALCDQFALLENMSPGQIAADPHGALEQLPLIEKSQVMQGSMRTTLYRAQQHLVTARARLTAVLQPAPTLPAVRGPLDAFLRSEARDQNMAAGEAADKISASIKAIEPLVARMQQEIGAMEKVIKWREYRNLSTQALALTGLIQKWGAASVQAYFMRNESGEYGPFEFEQRLDLGNAAVAVRLIGRTTMEAWNLKTGERLGRCEERDLAVLVTDAEGGASFPTAFHLTARCEELSVQLGYLLRGTQAVLAKVQGEGISAPSWCGTFTVMLGSNNWQGKINAEQQVRNRLWSAILSDLAQLGPFKERLATYFLVDRLSEMVPRFLGDLAQCKANYKQANVNIANIFAQCTHDPDTDRPIMPARLTKEYAENVRVRDSNKREIVGITAVINTLVVQAKARLGSRVLWGQATLPVCSALSPVSEKVANLVGMMTDTALDAAISSLEQQLNKRLRPEEGAAEEQAASDGDTIYMPEGELGARAAIFSNWVQEGATTEEGEAPEAEEGEEVAAQPEGRSARPATPYDTGADDHSEHTADALSGEHDAAAQEGEMVGGDGEHADDDHVSFNAEGDAHAK